VLAGVLAIAGGEAAPVRHAASRRSLA